MATHLQSAEVSAERCWPGSVAQGARLGPRCLLPEKREQRECLLSAPWHSLQRRGICRKPTRPWTPVIQWDETLGTSWEKVSILHVR